MIDARSQWRNATPEDDLRTVGKIPQRLGQLHFSLRWLNGIQRAEVQSRPHQEPSPLMPARRSRARSLRRVRLLLGVPAMSTRPFGALISQWPEGVIL